MSLTSPQYAGLADDSYSDRYPSTTFPPNERPLFKYGGVTYEIVEHKSNPRTGYQGTIYQRVDTGEIIVAHRGTEGDKFLEGWVKDGAITDGAMLVARINPQINDATALTDRAIKYAEREGREPGRPTPTPTPTVTVTGHSLGGALAQYTAHYFNLKGETFNAYGAASLGYRIPEGGDAVLNHVMAADTVSAASPHYGRVKVYATPKEIAMLHGAGYANDQNPLDLRAPGMAVLANAGSHLMHSFLDVDGNGKPDRSVLTDPASQQLAQMFDPMIDKFRNDVKVGRELFTALVRDPMGRMQDGIDYLHGPLEAGAPAAHDAQVALQQAEVARKAAALDEQVRQFREAHPSPFRFREVPDGPIPAAIARPGLDKANEPTQPYTLPDYGQPAQTSPRNRGHGGQKHRGDGPEHPEAPSRRNEQAIPADHRDHALFEAIRQRLPAGTSEEKTAEIVLQTKAVAGIRDPGQIKDIIVQDERVFVMGRTPGFRTAVDLSTPSPGLQDTLRRSEAFDHQQAQEQAQFQAQLAQANARNHGAPSLTM